MNILINGREFSELELKNLVLASFDKTSFAKNLGFNYFNGKISKKISQIIEKYKLSIDHFDATKKQKARRKFLIEKRICPICSIEFETQIGNKEERFTCSYKCSNIHFVNKRQTSESKIKKSKSLLNDKSINVLLVNDEIFYEKNCLICSKQFLTQKSKTRCCSDICASVLRNQSQEYHNKLSTAMQQRIANGLHKGWSTRLKLEPSYPEQYVISLLTDLDINLTREYKVNKWFIDFADINNKLALEIDGKQHNLPERKLSDEKKDEFLIQNGWKILRIKWKKIDKEFRDFLISSISDFIKGSPSGNGTSSGN